MANLKSALKRVDVNNKKRARNNNIKSDMRTNIKKVEKLIAANDVENAQTAFKATSRVIDKAIQKGAVHKNNGLRHKQRLQAKLNNVTA